MCLTSYSAREAVLAELASLEAEHLDASGLLAQIQDLAVFISQARGYLARLAGSLDAAGLAAERGYKSTAAFVRDGCDMTARHAAELVAVARGLRRCPATAQAVAAGTVSFDKAQIILRSAASISESGQAEKAERIMLDAAPGLDAALLRQLGEELAYRADPEAAEEAERRRFEKRHLSLGLTLDGTGTLTGACGDAASFEIVRTAAEVFGVPGGACDTRTAAQRRMDGLVTACKIALDSAKAPARHGAAPHVTILLRDETLSRSGQAPPARTGHGAALTARQVLSMCCDAQVTPIRWADGLPLDVGRASRTEPPGLRRALEARDRTCRWTGCDALASWCTGHHIRGWARGARTCLAEMVLLCHVHHHYFIHMLGWTITGDPNGTLLFTHPGKVMTLESPLPGRIRAP